MGLAGALALPSNPGGVMPGGDMLGGDMLGGDMLGGVLMTAAPSRPAGNGVPLPTPFIGPGTIGADAFFAKLSNPVGAPPCGQPPGAFIDAGSLARFNLGMWDGAALGRVGVPNVWASIA